MKRVYIFLLVFSLCLSYLQVSNVESTNAQESAFSFVVTADQRQYAGSGLYDSSRYYRGAMEAINALGGGAFMVSPGDIDPPADSMWTIEQVMGTDYLWYPVVGNHELPGAGSEAYSGANMDYLSAYNYDANGTGVPPDIVNTGPTGCPETTYSFDYENAHFVVLNEYCDVGGDDVTSGDVPLHLYNWLVADLQGTNKEHIFVFGHEPAYPQPDADNGRIRHLGDSLDQYPTNRNEFWTLLRNEGVVAYICGHTHNYSAVEIDGVWQLDAGHARGAGDTGAASTFLIVHVNGESITFDAYRDKHDNDYDYDDNINHNGVLREPLSPAAPTNLQTLVMSDSHINLTWDDNADNEDGFKIERSPNGSAWEQIDTVVANFTNYSDTGLASSTTYYYRVHAFNKTGTSGFSNTTSATTVSPQTNLFTLPFIIR